MEKVVSRGIKIDLHIHSEYSKAKDGKKVEENTLDNIPVLVQGLLANQVEMCAITDHDAFNYGMYYELKKEEQKNNCVKKVLPGIEFSVEFVEGKVIHIVTIFDDRDDEKVRNIQKIMEQGKGMSCYKKTKGAYTKSDYFDILSEINIDFIMIAHQKKTPSSQHKPHANDVMSLGKEIFNELVFMDYFDAYSDFFQGNCLGCLYGTDNGRCILISGSGEWYFFRGIGMGKYKGNFILFCD